MKNSKDLETSENRGSAQGNLKKEKVFSFQELATYIVKKEIFKYGEEINAHQGQISFFTTCFEHKEEMEEGPKKTITVWFEIKTTSPPFWDIQPVVIVYKGHKLFLSDIRERTENFVLLSLRRLRKRYFAALKG